LWDALTDSLPEISARQVATEYERSVCGRIVRAIVLELGRDLPHRAAAIYAHTVNLLVLLVRTLDAVRDRERPSGPESFAASLAELDDRFTEGLRIEELAKRAGMSYRSYTEHFRRRKGMTVTQYVTQRRIEFAKRRMLETEDILGSSLEAGFHDLSHFYRVFKRLEGETPLAFIGRHSLAEEDARSLP
jgi:AraC-like DNA-binding protein